MGLAFTALLLLLLLFYPTRGLVLWLRKTRVLRRGERGGGELFASLSLSIVGRLANAECGPASWRPPASAVVRVNQETAGEDAPRGGIAAAQRGKSSNLKRKNDLGRA